MRVIKSADRAGRHPLASLSQREHEIFFFLVEGMRPKGIATLLDISPKTVDTYRRKIIRQLGIRNTVGLVKFAIHHKLLPPSDTDPR